MIDRVVFFNRLRARLGHFRQAQVDGLELLLEAWEYIGWADLRWLAYCLATTWWETGHTMQPIDEEGKGAGHVYGLPAGPFRLVYYGRGYVQLTWYKNYVNSTKMLRDLGFDLVDLERDPEQAKDPSIAALVLYHGMHQGTFEPGATLEKYFPPNGPADPKGARMIVNLHDHDEAIAAIYEHFEFALSP